MQVGSFNIERKWYSLMPTEATKISESRSAHSAPKVKIGSSTHVVQPIRREETTAIRDCESLLLK